MNLRPVVAGRERAVCAHRATLSGRFPPNSLAGVEECVAGAVPRIEVDVRFLADDGLAVLHDDRLEGETTGSGPVERAETSDLLRLRLRAQPSLRPPFLAEVVDAMRGTDSVLHVDLKLMPPLSPARVGTLAAALAPLGDAAFVGSQAHWNLRLLHEAGVRVALDPMLHWHFNPQRRGAGLLPAQASPHGLWDDSPLAHLPGLTRAEYFVQRLADLHAIAGGAVEWLVDHATLCFLFDHGLALGAALAARGVGLAAWTVNDHGEAETVSLLHSLVAAGATTIISDDGPAIAAYLVGMEPPAGTNP